MAYFNTHLICDRKLSPDHFQKRARACAEGDEEGCFGCTCNDGQVGCQGLSEHCAPIEAWQQIGFNATLLSAFGARSLAQRESDVLQSDEELRAIRLVDGQRMTEGQCNLTADGRHYASVEVTEATAALEALAA